ncbi:hypothetical protein CDC7B_2196 [Corynebacterium diphtheriae C7 (beta)]|nr:hypothetical protein CDC7B_2196 [Corynebacterium diphtheriae C7 (beta)]
MVRVSLFLLATPVHQDRVNFRTEIKKAITTVTKFWPDAGITADPQRRHNPTRPTFHHHQTEKGTRLTPPSTPWGAFPFALVSLDSSRCCND